MFRFFAFASLVFLSVSVLSFAQEDGCFQNKETSLTFNDTVVKKDAKTDLNSYPYAFVVQTVRTITFPSGSSSGETMIGSDVRTTPQFLEALIVDPDVNEEQVYLAVKNPGEIVLPKVVKESFGGKGWLFKKVEKRGAIYKTQPKKSVSSAPAGEESSLSRKMLIPAILIPLLALFIGLMFNRLRKNELSDRFIKEKDGKKFGRIDSFLGVFCNPLSITAILSLLFCLYVESRMLTSIAEQPWLFGNMILNVLMIVSIPLFNGRYYRKLYSPVWAVLQLCCLIGFLAGWRAGIAYLGLAVIIFGLIYVIPRIFHKIAKKKDKPAVVAKAK